MISYNRSCCPAWPLEAPDEVIDEVISQSEVRVSPSGFSICLLTMTDCSSTSDAEDNRDSGIPGSNSSCSHLHALSDTVPPQPSPHPNGRMRLGKSRSSPATPVGGLPPLVGVPHDRPRNHPSPTPETSGIPAACRGVLDGAEPGAPAAPSPLMRRRLKYMVRQCSDSELLDNNRRSLGRLKLAPPGSGAASPVPHPPDASPRSLTSSESNSPRILRKPHAPSAPSQSGPARASRSLEASPLVGRRLGGAVRRHSSGQNSTPSSGPNSPHSGQRHPRPFSFGSYSDVVQFVSSGTDPRSPGSPFVSRRAVGVRVAGTLLTSRPDTPANEAISMPDAKKPHFTSSSAGGHSEAHENEATSLALEEHDDHESCILPRRRLRRDTGSQHAQRNSTGPALSDNNRNFAKKAQHPVAHAATSDYPHYPPENHVVDHPADDDTGCPSNLYDIQERRESILSIEAVQQIARRIAENGDNSSSESGIDDKGDERDKHRPPERRPTPEYRKKPLPADTRVSNWLRGIQDPTERVPTTLERILPDIL